MSNSEEQMKQTTIQTGTQMKITTKKIPTWGVLSGVLLLALGQALGQTLPLEIRQDQTPYNYQSAAGVPISTTVDAAIGSDGRAPTASQQETLSDDQPAHGEPVFRVHQLGRGGCAGDPVAASLQESAHSGNAVNIGLPHGGSGSSQVVLQACPGRCAVPEPARCRSCSEASSRRRRRTRTAIISR